MAPILSLRDFALQQRAGCGLAKYRARRNLARQPPKAGHYSPSAAGKTREYPGRCPGKTSPAAVYLFV